MRGPRSLHPGIVGSWDRAPLDAWANKPSKESYQTFAH